MRYVFGDYLLDTQRYELSCRNQPIKLRPKVFHVLSYLIAHRDRVVSKDELLEQVWPGQFIGDGSLNACLMAVRKAVGDSGQSQHHIQTLHGRGYRFIAAVEAYAEPALSPPESVALLDAASVRSDAQTRSCATCQHDNPASASFCNACGAPLGSSCIGCNADNPSEAQFCNRCGASLIGPAVFLPETQRETPSEPLLIPQETEVALTAPGAERRQLTVMFCDLVGSTALSGQLDPEEFREVVRAYQQVCADVIQSFDGHIAQYLGDGLLTYFGYPLAHEDDAQRAIRAGLEILASLKTLNTRLEREIGVQLAIRIGIHTGLVVMGEVGTGARQEQLALGHTPNLASRIQGIAAPDTVVISAATQRLAAGYFLCDALGVHHLEGVAQPVTVYRVRQDSGAQSRLDVPPLSGLTPLIGRESEIALLQERWAHVQEGAGQVILLSGDAGIGKSRLVQVLKDYVSQTAHTLLECRCSPYAQNSAWHPLIEVLPRLLNWLPTDSPDDKRVKLEQFIRTHRLSREEAMPLLATLLSLPIPDAPYPDGLFLPQEQRQNILHTLLTILLAFAAEQPLLWIVEDVHWIDPSTLALIDLVIEQGPTASICTVLTCRPTFQPAWGLRAHLTPLTLSRLPRSQAEMMIERVTGDKRLPDEVVSRLLDKTDGVPLYIEEMTKAVVESGWLQEVDGQYTLSGPLPELATPSTLQDSLMARLDRLGPAKRIAQLGATIGREFSYALLRAVAEVEEAVLQQALDRLLSAELVYQRGVVPQATYLFKHALIQDAAYQSLLKQTRRHIHRRIVEALEGQGSTEGATPPDVFAHHATEAGLLSRASDYWRRAGEHAFQSGAYQEAPDHFQRGLDLLLTLPEDAERTQREFDLLIALGPCLIIMHGMGVPEVERIYTRAYALCQQIKEAPQLFSALQGLRYFYWVRVELQTARELEERLVALAQSQQDPELLTGAHMSSGLSLYSLGEFALALHHFEQALTHCDPASCQTFQAIPHPEIACLLYSGLALWHLGYADQARVRIHEGLAIAEQLAHPVHQVWAEHTGAQFYLLYREPLAAREWADAVTSHTAAYGFPFLFDTAQFVRGWALAQESEGEEGIEQMQQAIAVYRRRNGELSMPRRLAFLAEAYGRLGQIEAGLQLLAEADALIDKYGERSYWAEVYRLKGELLQQVGDSRRESEPSPEACFQRALDIARAQQAKMFELRAAMSLSRLWQRQGQGAAARELLAQTYNWFTEGFGSPDLQEAQALLAELA
jgi:class 3 adenylate cyclase/DNA-binding winged helix-turn-helix (wHTH) protein/tetratricopeptide (TPR) repeat protein